MEKGKRQTVDLTQPGFFSSGKAPWRWMGPCKTALDGYRIMEDGTKTQNRLSAVESLIPPHSSGPIFHFHEMHDECFYVTKGTVRFHSPGIPDIDAKAGDFVTIPLLVTHKFSNPFDEEAIFVNLNTPGFYVNYFKLVEQLIGEGRQLTPELNREAMMRFATVPLTKGDIEAIEMEMTGADLGVDGSKVNA